MSQMARVVSAHNAASRSQIKPDYNLILHGPSEGKHTPKMSQVASALMGSSRLSLTRCVGCSSAAASPRMVFTTVSFSRSSAHILHARSYGHIMHRNVGI